jgi:hypothetical protein
MNTESTAVDPSNPPTSFTAFKPIGQVVVALPDNETATRARMALLGSGVDKNDMEVVASADMRLKMAQMLDLASGSAEFGHEIVAMRQFLALAADGAGWLLVKATDESAEQRIVNTVEPLGAMAAVKYGRLIITDLL